MTTTRLQLSRYVQVIDAGRCSLICHGPALKRIAVRSDIAQLLSAFETAPLSREELFELVDAPRATVERLVQFFHDQGILVPEDEDESARLGALLNLDGHDPSKALLENRDVRPRIFSAAPLSLGTFHDRGSGSSVQKLRMTLLGGCGLHVLTEGLKHEGLGWGLDLEVETGWADGPESFGPAAQTADVVVFQPAVRALLEPLWDHAPFLDADETERRVLRVERWLEVYLQGMADAMDTRLGLVVNIPLPQISPLGRAEFRRGRYSFSALVRRLNETIDTVVAPHTNLFVVDIERALAVAGKAERMDDLHAVYSHHGGLSFPAASVDSASSAGSDGRTATPAYTRCLAQEILHSYLVCSGWSRIKCVVTDLDNTLWPGVAGEEGFSWSYQGALLGGPFEGIHQALRILKHRGILLATCSRNDEASVLEDWRRRVGQRQDIHAAASDAANHLHPDDFVLHRINWNRKSDNLREIASQLGLSFDAMLFIDDNPVERAEVASALPSVRLLGEDLSKVRGTLLTDPCLDGDVRTDEARRRTEMVRAQLRREASRAEAPDELSFLRSLQIALTIRRAESPDLPRVAELASRTNQFNTTLARPGIEALQAALVRNDRALWVLHASDRYTAYGLVGFALLGPSEIIQVAMSCRVIGLQVAVPFLVTVLRNDLLAADRPLGRMVRGERNVPCRRLFLDAGFSSHPDGTPDLFVLENRSALATVDSTIYAVSQ